MSSEAEQLVEASVVLRLTPEVYEAVVKDAAMWQMTLEERVSSVVEARFTTMRPHEADAEMLRRKGITPATTRGEQPDDEYGY